MAKKFGVDNGWSIALKPKKRRTFTGKKYSTRKAYRGQGR